MSNVAMLKNARIVLNDEIIHGNLLVRDGMIAAIDCGSTAVEGLDFDDDLLIPGLVELHTDHLEKHVKPRPGVTWNLTTALFAHDAQLCGAGITTVLDAVRFGERDEEVNDASLATALVDQISQCRERNILRADHLLHIRCEVSAPDTLALFEQAQNNPLIRLVSLMDHTPGQRQFTDLAHWRRYYGGKTGKSNQELDRLIDRTRANAERYSDVHRRRLAEICRDKGYALASHDDATTAHVAEAVELGLTISEFPTTRAAAEAANHRGLKVVAGAPNVVRGGSHSGNVSAMELAADGYLDALSSDYVPVSLLHGALLLHTRGGIALPPALRKVTANPASMVGLTDRGEIAIGKRADLVRVDDTLSEPVVRQVWREGIRVT